MSFAAINRSKYSVVFVFQTKKKLIIYFHLNDSHVLTLKVSYRIEKKTQATGIIKKYNTIVYIVIILLVYLVIKLIFRCVIKLLGNERGRESGE